MGPEKIAWKQLKHVLNIFLATTEHQTILAGWKTSYGVQGHEVQHWRFIFCIQTWTSLLKIYAQSVMNMTKGSQDIPTMKNSIRSTEIHQCWLTIGGHCSEMHWTGHWVQMKIIVKIILHLLHWLLMSAGDIMQLNTI